MIREALCALRDFVVLAAFVLAIAVWAAHHIGLLSFQ